MKKPILLITSVFFALTCLPAQADNNGNSSFNHNTSAASYSGGQRNSQLGISTNRSNSRSFSHNTSTSRRHETDQSHHRSTPTNSYSRHSNNNARRHFNRGDNRYRNRTPYRNKTWNSRNSYNRHFYNRTFNNRSRQYGFTSGISLGLFTTGLFGNHSVIPYQPRASTIHNRFNRNSRALSNRYNTSPSHRTYRAYNSNSSSSRSSRGECFERTYDEQGNEIKIRLEAWECDF